MRRTCPLSLVLSAVVLIVLLLSLHGAGQIPAQGVALAAPNTTQYLYLPLISKNSAPPPPWLAEVNAMRALANLNPLSENTTWDLGDTNHAIYMVKTGQVGHTEDPASPWYTLEGSLAAQNSNVMGTSDINATDIYAVDLWMKGPFHAIGILDPRLQQTGFGSYRGTGAGWVQMAAALDVIRGLGSVPSGTIFPILWPANGKTSPFASLGGGEYPDPITSCPGYTYPAGMAIYIQLQPGITPNVAAYSFKRGTTSLNTCEFDQTNYHNPDANAQNLGRQVLGARNAIVLIPQSPLTAGASYTVSVTTNGSTYSWSFSVSNSPRAPAATGITR